MFLNVGLSSDEKYCNSRPSVCHHCVCGSGLAYLNPQLLPTSQSAPHPPEHCIYELLGPIKLICAPSSLKATSALSSAVYEPIYSIRFRLPHLPGGLSVWPAAILMQCNDLTEKHIHEIKELHLRHKASVSSAT